MAWFGGQIHQIKFSYVHILYYIMYSSVVPNHQLKIHQWFCSVQLVPNIQRGITYRPEVITDKILCRMIRMEIHCDSALKRSIMQMIFSPCIIPLYSLYLHYIKFIMKHYRAKPRHIEQSIV